MHSDGLTRDYLRRAKARLAALRVLMDQESRADVVRESQEIVQITLKALLRANRIEVPGIHDVSPILEQNRSRFGKDIGESLDELMKISRSLRRDRELAFCGSEDLTPSEFYKGEDAEAAHAQARFVYDTVERSFAG
jgi:hypothetical protein